MMTNGILQSLIGSKAWGWSLLRLGLLIYLALCGYAFFFSDRLLFQPGPASYEDSEAILKLPTPSGEEIAAIYLPNPEADFTILYSHGNGEDMGDMMFLFHELRVGGFAVFAYDYRGYGTSEGQPSEKRVYQDINTAYRYLTQTLEVPPERIIALGRSLGGGPSVDLAAREPLGGLILESTFTTAFRVMTRISILPFDKFANIGKLDRVNCPILVIHGTADNTIPQRHGQQLFKAAKEPKQAFWVEGAGHNNLWSVAGDRYLETIRAFARSILNPSNANRIELRNP